VQDKPILTVFNKIDKLGDPSEADINLLVAELGIEAEPWVAISAQRGEGLDELHAKIEQLLTERMVPITAHIPYRDNELVALWHERGVIESEEFGADGTTVIGAVPRRYAHRYEQFRLK
jgi:GTPase